jgi:PPOX class probable F420-dependent enzyme
VSDTDQELQLRRFAAARVARLATASAEARPHLVPFCFAVVGDAVYSLVDDKPKRTRTGLRRLRNLAANPRAALLVDHYEEDWSALWFVLVEGPAGLVEDEGEYGRALEALRAKYPQYEALEPSLRTHPMIRIGIERLVSWGGRGL